MARFVRWWIAVGTFVILLPVAAAHNLDGTWPMFRRTPAHTATGFEYAPQACETLWTFNFGDPQPSSPVAVDDHVFFGDGRGRVFSINATDGREVWRAATDAAVVGAPAVVSGVVYVTSRDGFLHAFDESTGAELWNYAAGVPIETSPTVVDGVAYFGDNAGGFHAVDVATHEARWRQEDAADGAIASSAAYADGRLFFGSLDNRVYALWASNGTRIWSFLTKGDVLSSPSVHEGRVFVGGMDGRIYAFDPATRASPWQAPYDAGAPITASPAAGFEGVFVPSVDGKLHAVYDGNGQRGWAANLSGASHSSPAAILGLVILGDSSGDVHAFDVRNGAHRWTCSTGGAVTTSPAVAAGRVFVTAADGRLYALGEANLPPNVGPSLGEFQPSDGATDRPLDVTLAWAATDPDTGDYLRATVRFGATQNPPIKASNLAESYWRPASLEPGTTYYWRVLLRDNHGAEAAGPLLSFTTSTGTPTPTEEGSAPGDESPAPGPTIAILGLFLALLLCRRWRL